MKECGVCGILYLAGGSCPACGSQIQKRSDDFQDADMILPTEVPGLEDATDAWYELEGVERPQEEVQVEKSSSLPFGFSGESLTNVSRLPFGIGSHRDGIPFDVALSDEQPEDSLQQQTAMESSEEENAGKDDSNGSEDSRSSSVIEEPPSVPMLPDVTESTVSSEAETELIRIMAVAIDEAPHVDVQYPEIPLDVEVESEIYSSDDDVVEVVFSDLADTVVHVDHGNVDSFSQPQVVEYAEKVFTPFDLHPARAMTIQASNNGQVKGLVEEGFMAIGRGDWRAAARSFQRVLASEPQDVGAMNNYGISLLQVATTMQESADPIDVSNAATQFEAAILSLREAVRTNPKSSEPFYNLAQALLLSGREEKALDLLAMVPDENKSQSHFVNLQAAILAQLGQYGEAKSVLAPIQGEPLISQNLLKLPSL